MTQPDFESGRFGVGRKGREIEPGMIWGRPWGHPEAEDHQVADAVANALHWDFALPRYRVVAHCDGGWVTLTGEVERAYQRSAAEADVLRVEGVRGVTNAITVCAAAATRVVGH